MTGSLETTAEAVSVYDKTSNGIIKRVVRWSNGTSRLVGAVTGSFEKSTAEVRGQRIRQDIEEGEGSKVRAGRVYGIIKWVAR
jgi:hypothetical protein